MGKSSKHASGSEDVWGLTEWNTSTISTQLIERAISYANRCQASWTCLGMLWTWLLLVGTTSKLCMDLKARITLNGAVPERRELQMTISSDSSENEGLLWIKNVKRHSYLNNKTSPNSRSKKHPSKKQHPSSKYLPMKKYPGQQFNYPWSQKSSIGNPTSPLSSSKSRHKTATTLSKNGLGTTIINWNEKSKGNACWRISLGYNTFLNIVHNEATQLPSWRMFQAAGREYSALEASSSEGIAYQIKHAPIIQIERCFSSSAARPADESSNSSRMVNSS